MDKMDMATRTFVLAAALALFAAAGLVGWGVLSGGVSGGFAGFGTGGSASADARADLGADVAAEGSLYDEFGAFGEPAGTRETARPGSVFSVSSADRSTQSAFGSGPRFDWSGPSQPADVFDLPRETPAERVEADCQSRGFTRYGCRCLVRLARRDLSEAEFAFLSLTEEQSTRAERLQASGLSTRDLAAMAAKLIALDAQSRRRCGAGLAY